MKKLLLVCAFAIAATSTTGCIISSDGDSSITIFNDSNFILIDIAVAEIDDPTYGPNLIPDDLLPGESVTVILDCGVYDVQIVDEFNAVCEIFDIDVCFDDAGFFIDNQFLATCGF